MEQLVCQGTQVIRVAVETRAAEAHKDNWDLKE